MSAEALEEKENTEFEKTQEAQIKRILNNKEAHAKAVLNRVTEDVINAGLKAPDTDNDKRSQIAWDEIRDLIATHSGVMVHFVKEFDYSKLADINHPWFGFFQIRGDDDAEDFQSRVDDNVEKFFGKNPEKLIRAPIIFKFKDLHFAAFGNGRGYAFKQEEKPMPAIVIDCDNLHKHEFLDWGFRVASQSNRTNEDSVKPEGNESYVNQLRCLRKIEEYKNDCSQRTEDDWIQWAEDCLRSIYDLRGDNKKGRRTRIINQAFEKGVHSPIAERSNKEIQSILNDHPGFEDFDWNPNDKELTNDIAQWSGTTNETMLQHAIRAAWLHTPPDAHGLVQRKEMVMSLRPGKSFKDLKSSIVSVEKDIKTTLKKLASLNLSGHYKQAGMPLVTAVLFPKHLQTEESKDQLYVWNKQKKEFKLVSKRKK